MSSLTFSNLSLRNQRWLRTINTAGIKLGLENMQKLMQALGNPQAKLRIIHCAGTNGKGSTLLTLEQLLVHSGYKVGTTLSPHLVTVNERFRIQQKIISNDVLNNLLDQICKACGATPYSKKPTYWKIRPTFFEVMIAAAFLGFSQANVDVALIETGLGGRLDATNLAQSELCLLTAISFDHEKILGNSLVEIVTEKLGIVKTSAPVLSVKQVPAVQQKIEKHCANLEAPCWIEDLDFGFKTEKEGNEFYSTVSPQAQLRLKNLGLKGEHQWNNTALALAAYFHFVPQNQWLSEAGLKQRLENVRSKGRMQSIIAKPNILLDGAHNPASIEALIKYMEQNYAQQKILVGISWIKGKKIPLKLFERFGPSFQPILFTHMQQQQSLSGYPNCAKILPSLTVEQFVHACKTKRYAQGYDQIVVTGSLYLVGEFLHHWQLQTI